MTLTVGHIAYANCAPFFRFLEAAGFQGDIVYGVPSQLNRMLACGQIDLSPSSSFEYADHWRDYLLLPGQSISSIGPVQSVLLFAPGDLQELDGVEIALTGESATSVNLLRILLQEFVGFPKVASGVPEQAVEEIIAQGRPGLLIGDRALRAGLSPPPGMRVYDLGELWYRFTGLPFVFALWIVRRDAAEAKAEDLARFAVQLAESRDLALANYPSMAQEAPERHWLGEERLVDYWQRVSYDLSGEHLKGLELFFSLCVKHQLLPYHPEISFWLPPV